MLTRLSNLLMNTRWGSFLAAACCFWFGVACFVLAYDFTASADHPAWYRFGAIVIVLWFGVRGLQQGKRLWIRRSVLKRSVGLGDC
jgi:hypothetical protein